MILDAGSEIVGARRVLRDLVALSAIPAAWFGREPLAVANGLADTLIGVYELDVVAVRLCDPDLGEAVEVLRGDGQGAFTDWLTGHIAERGRLSRTETVADVGIGARWHRGVVIPIGLNSDVGVVAAATDRANFPTAIDQMLLRLAANQAATAFHNSCLISQRTRAEEELRRARDDLEARVAEQTDELRMSRVRIVSAADEMRRQIERDLHDSVQQRIVTLALALRTALAEVPAEQTDLHDQLSRVADGLTETLDEVRELSRGIHPAILASGGLVPALKNLARRSAVPVALEVELTGRLPEPVEVAAYYVVSEALTNCAKHAHASAARVGVGLRDGAVGLSIVDDGVGGADPRGGSGLIGLADRVDAIGGRIEVTSPPGRGTTLRATLPFTKA
jgi:signal transduction histidine kinase